MNNHTMRWQADRVTGSDVAWREARLRVAGFEWETASHLARDDGVDLHELLELVDRGCPPHLAARILAPLESERGSG
jgi:hypothetical protein